MIVIKGNLTIDKSRRVTLLSLLQKLQIEKSNPSLLVAEATNREEIVSLVDLDKYDTRNAVVIDGDVTVSDIDIKDRILVTGEVIELGGEYDIIY